MIAHLRDRLPAPTVPAQEQFGQAVDASCAVIDGEVCGMDVDGLLREAKAAGIPVEDFHAGNLRSAILAVVAARLESNHSLLSLLHHTNRSCRPARLHDDGMPHLPQPPSFVRAACRLTREHTTAAVAMTLW